MTLDVRRALALMSDDPRASEKFGLGAVVSLAPILNLAAIGYQVDVARRVARGEPRPAPEWNDLQRLWVQGAVLGLAYFIYALPLQLMVLAGMATVFAGLVLSLQSEPARSGLGAPQPPIWVLSIFVVLVGAALVYGLIFGLLRPAILATYAQRDRFQACFDFGALGRFIRFDLRGYLQAWLAELLLGWLISVPLILMMFIVGFIPFVGPLLIVLIAAGAGFFVLLVSGHLAGQLLRARPHSIA